MNALRPLAIAAAALAVSGTGAFAYEISNATYPDTSNAVFVGGTPICRVKVSDGGYSPEQRASAIQDRINLVLGTGPIWPEDVSVNYIGDQEYGVYVKGRLIMTADKDTADFNQTSTRDLAFRWAHNLRNVLPGLTEPK